MADQGVAVRQDTVSEVERLEEGGCTAVVAAVGRRPVAVVAVADAVKPEAGRVVAALHRMGLRVWMMTGDSR
jgi:P-type E1-E2 ATPase